MNPLTDHVNAIETLDQAFQIRNFPPVHLSVIAVGSYACRVANALQAWKIPLYSIYIKNCTRFPSQGYVIETAGIAQASGLQLIPDGPAVPLIGIAIVSDGPYLQVACRYGAEGNKVSFAKLHLAAMHNAVQVHFAANEILHAAGCDRVLPGDVQAQALDVSTQMMTAAGMPVNPELDPDGVDAVLQKLDDQMQCSPDGVLFRADGGQVPFEPEVALLFARADHVGSYLIPINKPIQPEMIFVKQNLNKILGKTGIYVTGRAQCTGQMIRSCYGRGDLLVAHAPKSIKHFDYAITEAEYIRTIAEMGIYGYHHKLQHNNSKVFVLILPGKYTDHLSRPVENIVYPLPIPDVHEEF